MRRLNLIENIAQVPHWRETVRYGGHSFMTKNEAVPLQAADLFAYEWTKFRDETLEQNKRVIRKSLLSLFQSDPKRYGCYHLTGKPLQKYFNKIWSWG